MSTSPAQPNQTTWWPSRYGPNDQAGSLNEIRAANVVRAAQLVRHGRIYDLSHELHEAIPAFPGRSFRQHLTTSAHQLNLRRPDAGETGWGANNVNWIVEQVSSTSQMGTHIDSLNHLQIGDRAYNGHRLADIVEEHGTNRLGIEQLPQVVTRGLLFDIAKLRPSGRLGSGEVITPADAVAAAKALGVEVEPGNGVFFHTGWGERWDEPERYLDGEPGPGTALAQWLVDKRVSLTGCDTWSFGPVPAEDPSEPFFVPQTLNVKHGVVIVENLRLCELAADGVGEFMLVVSHANLRGATGAWVAPVAIV